MHTIDWTISGSKPKCCLGGSAISVAILALRMMRMDIAQTLAVSLLFVVQLR
jgi:hypothetical protein